MPAPKLAWSIRPPTIFGDTIDTIRNAAFQPVETPLRAGPAGRARAAVGMGSCVSCPGSPTKVPDSELLQRVVDELHADGALAHRRGDPLDAGGADVSDREDAGDARLHQMRPAREGPLRFGQLLRLQVASRLDEALVV